MFLGPGGLLTDPETSLRPAPTRHRARALCQHLPMSRGCQEEGPLFRPPGIPRGRKPAS